MLCCRHGQSLLLRRLCVYLAGVAIRKGQDCLLHESLIQQPTMPFTEINREVCHGA
jgi:hypothetical protein